MNKKDLTEEKNNNTQNQKQEKNKQQKEKTKSGFEKQEELIQKRQKKRKIFLICCVLLMIILIFSIIFSILNIGNDNIIAGVRIENIDMSGLSEKEAIEKLNSIYKDKQEKDILLKREDYTATINPTLLGTNFNIEKAIEEANDVGRDGNIFINNYKILFTLILKKNISLDIQINEDEARKTIEDIGSKMPDAVEEPSYYIEDNKLIITKGKEGAKIETEILLNKIKENLHDRFNKEEYLEIPVKNKIPEEIDIEKIHKEVYKKVQDAYFTKDPFKIYPEAEGIDFDIEAAKKLLKQDQEQYEIPLIITKPEITMTQIGSEAFPDVIATFTTRFDATDVDRTTNLKIACEKINDKIVLQGETFSYNQTLGERTIKAGYKNAKVYENGKVVDGIGGGICQISSTLYNAVLLSNMEIVERRNHQFVTSYLPAGRDATVVYGLTDFKFKNTRTYAIKIKASANNGIASISIYGIKQDEEYAVSFNTKTLSTIPYTVAYQNDASLDEGQENIKQKGANGMICETYITKKINGKVISTELLSKDTYNAMQQLVVKGTRKVSAQPVEQKNENNDQKPQTTETPSAIDIPKPVENTVEENDIVED